MIFRGILNNPAPHTDRNLKPYWAELCYFINIAWPLNNRSGGSKANDLSMLCRLASFFRADEKNPAQRNPNDERQSHCSHKFLKQKQSTSNCIIENLLFKSNHPL